MNLDIETKKRNDEKNIVINKETNVINKETNVINNVEEKTLNSNRPTGSLVSCKGLWTHSSGGVYYSSEQLLYGNGEYMIGKTLKNAEHPYEL